MVDSDECLMKSYSEGSYEAFCSLYERYSDRIYRFIRSRVQSQEISDDIFQKVFMKLHETRETYNPKFLFAPWLFMICRQTLVDFTRRERSQSKLRTEFKKEIKDDFFQEPEGEPNLVIPLAGLSSEERLIVEKRYFEEKDFEHLAQELGIQPAAARKRVSRAISKLKKLVRAQ